MDSLTEEINNYDYKLFVSSNLTDISFASSPNKRKQIPITISHIRNIKSVFLLK